MSDQSYVSTRRIGDATISVINEAVTRIPLTAVFAPSQVEWLRANGEADSEDCLTSYQAVILVRLADAMILIDPAFDDPGTPWDQHFATTWPGVERTPGMEAGLASLGVAPEAITHVLITHAHDDHFAGVLQGDRPRFPNARHLIGRADWEGNPRRTQSDGDLVTRLGRIADLGLLDLVDGDRVIVPGVLLQHAPGETPGHSIVRVESGGQTFYALGDLFHHASEVEHLDWVSPWVDLPVMRTSRDGLIAEAVPRNATIIFTHDTFVPWGHIVPDGDGHRWQRDE
jgi:glyoxylase-like metal-dependent hydrolase (beta-lactamase superfamily II)